MKKDSISAPGWRRLDILGRCGRGGVDEKCGGEGGIRTPGTVSRTHAFQACSFSHSDTSPHRNGRVGWASSNEGAGPREEKNGGEGEIRTPGTLASTPVFETGPFGRSGTSPPRPTRPSGSPEIMAEREGFEPPVPLRAQRFSKPPRSATPASLRVSIRQDRGPPAEAAHSNQSFRLRRQNLALRDDAGRERVQGPKTCPSPPLFLRRRKNSLRISPHSTALIPPATSGLWLFPGWASTWCTERKAPAFGSSAP